MKRIQRVRAIALILSQLLLVDAEQFLSFQVFVGVLVGLLVGDSWRGGSVGVGVRIFMCVVGCWRGGVGVTNVVLGFLD